MKRAGSATDPLWYKDAVIYELHVRAFADSNGDGIGDFRGLIGKLDYLQELGVTCLWLLPFFPSPLRDDGYDIANYTDVHPSYGTLADFQEFLEKAHARGMQVLIELVMNHSSDQHPWFERARKAPPGSPERNFYVWNDDNERFPMVPIIFSDTETSNWTWDPVAQAYYWHRFFSHQPDLNFDNPLVLEEMLKAMRFWLDMGVDALRMDAIPYLVERDGTDCAGLPETHAIIKHFRAVMDAEYTNRFVLAEANQWPADVRPYFGDGDECQMAFHFPLMPRIYVAIRQEDTQPILDIMAQTPELPPTCQWGLFLRNHDELTLEMVTKDERDYMYLAYSADPRTRINLGIRRRLAPLLDNNRQRIELLNSLLFSFPGTPILYYGDEIGMGDNINLGDRNGVRTPMQWNAEPNGGFSTAPEENLYSPVIKDSVYGYAAVNVAEQVENASSILQWTRNMIGLRKLFPVFGRGTQRFLDPLNRKVLAYLRQLDGETVLCVANLSRFAQPVTLTLDEFEGRVPVEMFGYTAFPKITNQPYAMTLSPYAFLWFQLQPVYAAEEPVVVQPETAEQAEQLTPVASEQEAQEEQGVPAAAVHTGSAANLVLHLAPGSMGEVHRMATLMEQLVQKNPALHITVAYPRPIDSGRGNADGGDSDVEAQIPSSAAITLAPYEERATAVPQRWPHHARTYAELGRLAQEYDATALMLFGQDTGSLNPIAVGALSKAILTDGFDLAVPLYQAGRYEALFNTGVLHPLTRALYGADIRFPLAADMALSRSFCERLASVADRFDVMAQDENILWPVTEGAGWGCKMVQVGGWSRHFAPLDTADLTQLLTQILGALFADAEQHAGQWQKGNPLIPLRTVTFATMEETPPDADEAPDAAEMYESFHMAAGHLQDVWSRAMAPGTQLR
ncbi:MAG TPA: maltose alpha-D-glucosyltransferase, partial [Acidobacteriaceae bacterium]